MGPRQHPQLPAGDRIAVGLPLVLRPRGAIRPVAGVGDEAYRRPPVAPDGPLIVLRVGRYLALVGSSGTGDPKPMAEVVARDLRRLGP